MRLLAARPRLVRFCARLTGDPVAAEDLAQETLLLAWRHTGELRDPAAAEAWLFGIARNVCRQWARTRARERMRVVPLASGSLGGADAEGTPVDEAPDGFDLELELEHDELAELLDRALALLPAATRQVLVERYVHERAQAEVAGRLGLSENVVAVRLHRGKLALRHALATTFQAEAISYGLLRAETVGWQETRLWCPQCGRRHLAGRMPAPPANTAFQLRCPGCHAEPGVYLANAPRDRILFDLSQVSGFKRLLDRLMAETAALYRPTLAPHMVGCPRCGQPMTIRQGMPPDGPRSLREQPGVYIRCARCGWEGAQGISGLLLCLPEGRRFWRRHQRIHLLPRRIVEAEGSAALVTSFVEMSGSARLDIISAVETHQVLRIHQEGEGRSDD
ncbi:MAG TPA: RNA polymerase sigma factor [Ktedonobacterales bacterium]